MAARTSRPPLMLVHGAWLSSASWHNFIDYFTGRGFIVSAPEWPRKHGDVEELRESADEIKGLGISEIVSTTRNRSMPWTSRQSSSGTRLVGSSSNFCSTADLDARGWR